MLAYITKLYERHRARAEVLALRRLALDRRNASMGLLRQRAMQAASRRNAIPRKPSIQEK